MKEYAAKLLELDRQARALMEEATAYQEQARADAQAQKDALLGELEEHAAAHIRTVRETETAVTAREAEALEKHYSALSRQLEESYSHSRQAWEDELARRCVEEW